MITILSASNRSGNLTAYFTRKCEELLGLRGEGLNVLYLDELPESINLKTMYDFESSDFTDYSKKYIESSDKFLVVVPEYNGSIPGILKLFIDAVKPEHFAGKKAAIIGVAAGRAGNLRGMDHLTDILHHLQVNVMPQKLPISQVHGLLKGEEVADADTLSALSLQMDRLIDF